MDLNIVQLFLAPLLLIRLLLIQLQVKYLFFLYWSEFSVQVYAIIFDRPIMVKMTYIGK